MFQREGVMSGNHSNICPFEVVKVRRFLQEVLNPCWDLETFQLGGSSEQKFPAKCLSAA